ncbi:hypothetical protein MauCBS54593_001776 [Microsporum audouinii]
MFWMPSEHIGKKRQKDPLGWHLALCYKDEEQLAKGTHVARHSYVKGTAGLEFVQVTHDPEKADGTLRKFVWPSEEYLKEAPVIGYGHLAGDGEA